MCPEFILTVQIIRALVTVNVIFFWTTKSYPIWSHFSFQIIPFKDPTEMISPSPQEWDEEKSRWKRKKSQLWSFSFHFSTYCDLHNFHYFAMFSLFSQLSVHKHLPTLLSVQSLSRVRLFVTPWITASQASLSITNSWSSLRLTSIKSVMPSSHLILGHPLLLLPPIPPSITVFSNESSLRMRWPKYWSLSFSIVPSKEHLGLISFRMDWLDLLAVQGILKSLLQHHSYYSPC